MAKMFYTIDEVSQKLGKSHDEIKEMVKQGQIQEFRDRDKLMFKVEQIDLLAGDGDEDTGDEDLSISLEDTGGGASGSGIALADSRSGASDSREGTGISVFDTDHGEEDVESEQTRVGETLEDELNLESVGSGSGLLDLTKESDDTALGAELLEEVYSSDKDVEIPANASGLFEAAPEQEHGGEEFGGGGGGRAAMPVMVEAYDGGGSGLGVGMLVGATVALIMVTIIAMVAVNGATPQLATSFASNLWIWVGGLLGVTVVLGGVGWFIGRMSE